MCIRVCKSIIEVKYFFSKFILENNYQIQYLANFNQYTSTFK